METAYHEECIYTAFCISIALPSIHLFRVIAYFFGDHQRNRLLHILPTHIISLLCSHKHLPSRSQSSCLLPLILVESDTPIAASKATKVSRPPRRFKAKGGKKRSPPKASSTNRVRKPAATGRNKRGYVYINENSQTETSSRTVNPDCIPETPPPSGR